MTKDEAQEVWAAASEYHWRGFEHWWEEKGRNMGWVLLTKEEPTPYSKALVHFKNGHIDCATFDPDSKSWDFGDNTFREDYETVLHWQYFPEPPTHNETNL